MRVFFGKPPWRAALKLAFDKQQGWEEALRQVKNSDVAERIGEHGLEFVARRPAEPRREAEALGDELDVSLDIFLLLEKPQR